MMLPQLKKSIIGASLALITVGSAFAADAPKAATPTAAAPTVAKKPAVSFPNKEDEVSYIIGHQIASSIMNDGLKVNRELLIKSLQEGLGGKESSLTQQETQEFMSKYISEQQKAKSDKNLKIGQEFLNKNKSKSGVVTLPSGLQYKVVAEGKGAAPKATDTVTVDYEGTLVDGKVFDSSYKRGQPVSFPVNGVIKGWTEALQLMKPGSTYELYIPANLAYGPQAPSPIIGPNSTLVFKVHLISVANPPQAVGATGDKSKTTTK